MSNYATIKINGADVKLRFGLPCLKYIWDSKILLGEIGKTYQDIAIAHILFGGYANDCILKCADPVLTIDDFMDYVEDTLTQNPAELNGVMEIFNNSKTVKENARKGQEMKDKEEKKNQSLTGTASSLSVTDS